MKPDKKFAAFLAATTKRVRTGEVDIAEARSLLWRTDQHLDNLEHPKRPPIKNDETEEDLQRQFKSLYRHQRAAEASALSDAPAPRKKIEHRDPVFMSALYAQAGKEPGFADEMLKALQRGDVAVFKTVMAAMETTKKILKRRLEKRDTDKNEPSFAAHAIIGHRLLDRIERTGKTMPTKKELENAITAELRKSGHAAYTDEKDWGKLWKYLGVKDADQAHVGRSKTYSGKGRTAKGWDA